MCRSAKFIARSFAVALAVWLSSTALSTSACPFCKALEPTLSQRRESAATVVLAELVEPSDEQPLLRVHQVLKGQGTLRRGASVSPPLDIKGRRGGLYLLFGEQDRAGRSPALDWSAVAVNETSFVYLANAPNLRTPNAERLRYFVNFLEHPDPLIAADAYFEFGHAPYEEVAQVADLLPMASLRRWLLDENVRSDRKGFYALTLALAKGEANRRTNRAILEKIILDSSDDFSQYLDGVIAAYWLLADEPGLEVVEKRILANPDSADGLVRHAVAAARFYDQYPGNIPRSRLARALRYLLHRPEFASSVIVDLARWEDWGSLEQIVALVDQADYPQPETRRAVVGYLLTCPEDRAGRELDRLRRIDPQAVAEAEAYFTRFGGNR